jgi:class 3 adenylate cyclase/tetratricopeptide (TPR) repeat protein
MRRERAVTCSGCGSALVDPHRFCPHCGTTRGWLCPTCKLPAAAEDASCRHCGSELLDAEETQRGPSYADDQKEIFKSQIAGERKRITMMFADVAGSTDLIANLDPEQGSRFLLAVLEEMVAAVEEFGGVVNQVSGDGIMALFGAPLAMEDHAKRACYAALHMQDRVHGHTFAEACGQSVRVRVGLHSGEVVAAERGHGFDRQYTAFGRASYIAARLEQAARPDLILMSDATHALVAPWVHSKCLGPIPLKGLRDPVVTYQLSGAVFHRHHVRSLRDNTPFVGRKALLSRISTIAEQAFSGRGQAVLLTGEPGIGKSRLCQELIARIEPTYKLLQCGGISFIRPTPYHGALEWLQTFWRADGDDIEQEVRGWLTSLGPSAAVHAPAILALAGADSKDRAWGLLSAADRRKRTVRGIIDLLMLQARRGPMMLFVEDVQWLDDATIEVMHSLVERIEEAPVMLLITARRDELAGGFSKPPITTIEMANFSERETAEFIDALVGGCTSSLRIKQQLFEHTGGNAFFIEETLTSMKATDLPLGTDDLSAAGIPDTVQGLIAMRIDRLSPPAKAALQAAAVLGANFDSQQMASLAAVKDQEGEITRHLVEHGFLAQSADAGRIHFAFRHALGREVAYAGLLTEHRKGLHARALQLLEESEGIQPSVLAYHASRGENWERAHRYSLAAGEISLARSASREALHFFEEALQSLLKLCEDDVRRQAELKLRFIVRNTLFSLGRAREIGPHLLIAEELAQRLGDRSALARAQSLRSHHAWLMAQWADAITVGEAALRLSNDIGDVGLTATTIFFMGLSRYSLGEYATSADLFMQNRGILAGELAHERFGAVGICSVVSNSFLSIALLELGRFDEARSAAACAQSIAGDAGAPFDWIQANLATAGVDLARGQVSGVVPLLEQTLGLCRTSAAVLIPRTLSALAFAYALEGRGADVIKLSMQEEAGGEAINSVKPMTLRMMAEALLLADRIADARGRAQALVELSRSTAQPGAEAWGLYFQAAIHTAQHMFDDADELLRICTGVAGPRRMIYLLARCGLLEAEIAHMSAKPNAECLRERAESRCHAIGLGAWVARSPWRKWHALLTDGKAAPA